MMKSKKKMILILSAVILVVIGVLVGVKLITDKSRNSVMGAPEGATFDFISWLPGANAEETAAEADEAESSEETEAQAEDPHAAMWNVLAASGIPKAESYLVISTGNYFYPVALNEENAGREFKLTLGEDTWNTVTIGKNSFYMSESSCPDQICIMEGEVTLENRGERMLGSFVYCLPNQVSLQLVDPDEMEAILKDAGML